MAEVATLGIRIVQQGAPETTKALGGVATEGKRAEKVVRELSAAQQQATAQAILYARQQVALVDAARRVTAAATQQVAAQKAVAVGWGFAVPQMSAAEKTQRALAQAFGQ